MLPVGTGEAAGARVSDSLDYPYGHDARLYETGGVFVAAVSEWLHSSPPDRRRTLVLEECAGRWSDPFWARNESRPGGVTHVGERVYHVASTGDAKEIVARSSGDVNGCPGVGVLSELPAGAVVSGELATEWLDAITRGAIAVVVRAWDDEAFLIAAVSGSPIASQLAS